MKNTLRKYTGSLVALMLVVSGGVIHAQTPTDGVPPVDLSAPTQDKTPFGAFKIAQCDGPEQLNHVKPATADSAAKYDKSFNFDRDMPAEFLKTFGHAKPFVPCDFRGTMIQIQFLINAMITLGVLAALLGFCYAGFLYITGVEKNISKAKSIFPKIFWGFVIMLTAWFVVYQILRWLTPPEAGYLQ